MRYPFLWIWNIKVKFFISLSSAKGKGSAMSAFCINIYRDTIRFTHWYCNWPILAFWLHVLIPVKSRYLPLWLVLWHYGWWICLCRQETLLVPKKLPENSINEKVTRIQEKHHFLYSFHPNISMHILHTVLYTFPKVLMGRTCFIIQSFSSWWPFSLFSLP